MNRLSASHAVLWISSTLWFALPELATAGSGCVAVLWAWAEGFLFLVVLDEEEGEGDGEEEEDSVRYVSIQSIENILDMGSSPSNNSNSETSSLQSARSVETRHGGETTISRLYSVSSIDIASSVGCVHHPAAAGSSSSIDPRHISECSSEAEIKEDGNGTEECDATQTADEEETNDGVDDRCTRDAFRGAKVVVDSQVVVGEGSEEVGEDGEDDGTAEELDDAHEEGNGFDG